MDPQEPSGKKPDFAAMAAHDLLEPVRKIIACCERLEARILPSLDERSREDLRRMRCSVGRIQGLLDNMLDLSAATYAPFQLRSVPLGAVVAEAIADVEEQFQSAGARILVGDLPTVVANRDQLRRVFQNLLANALKFRAEERPLLVRIKSRGANTLTCEVTISDNGIGIEESERRRIFQPFQRGRSVAKTSGSGLGLAICQTILTKHKGSIAVRGGSGVGTTFIVTLPLGSLARKLRPEADDGVAANTEPPFAAPETRPRDEVLQDQVETQAS